MYNVRASQAPLKWLPELAKSKPEALWHRLQDYDFQTRAGIKSHLDRYQSIKPFEYNMWHDEVKVPYFNGSKYSLTSQCEVVAMQAPLPHTIEHFVILALRDKITAIVTLGKERDGDFQKMDVYWEGWQSGNGYEIRVAQNSVERLSGFDVRRLILVGPGGERHECLHFHLHAWPDHLTPNRATFEDVMVRVLALIESRKNSLVVVHCSAGVGRTGTFLAALKLRLDKVPATLRNVYEAVAFVKLQRFFSVESKEQFEFLCAV